MTTKQAIESLAPYFDNNVALNNAVHDYRNSHSGMLFVEMCAAMLAELKEKSK